MATTDAEALVITAGTLSVVLTIYGTRAWPRRRRRVAFRAAAVRAGVEPGDGPWVEARVGTTSIVAREWIDAPSRGDPVKWTSVEAALPGRFPEAFHASTDEHAIGLLRATFPTTSGRHTVFVRGLDEVDVTQFLDAEVRRALAEGLDLAPDAEVVPNAVRLSRSRWYPSLEVERILTGFVRICSALARPPSTGYRG